MTPRYASPLVRSVFKKIFSNEEVMIAFLRDLLHPASSITKVSFLGAESVVESAASQGIIFDLRCHTSEGQDFFVEILDQFHEDFYVLILQHLTRTFSDLRHNNDTDWNYEKYPVYGIFLLNFHLSGFKPQGIRTVQVKTEENNKRIIEELSNYTSPLHKTAKELEETEKNKIQMWLHNLIYMDTMTTSLAFQAEQPIFQKVGELAEITRFTEEESLRYEIDLNHYRTNLSVIKTEWEIGYLEGIAIRLKHNGLPIEKIAEYTGFTVEELAELV